MVPTSKVVEDGLEAPRRVADRSRWGWLGAGLLIGAGVAVMILGVDEGVPRSDPTTPGTPVEETGGIGDVIPGFPDALVGTIRSNGRSLGLLVWPGTASSHETSVTIGASDQASPVSFDTSGGMLATVLPLDDAPVGGALYAGVPDRASIVALDVTGFAWHDTHPQALAYTTVEDDELLLWVTSNGVTESTMIARAVGIEGGVVGWGEWGFAVQDGDSIVLLTGTGEITSTHPGSFLASSGEGRLAIDDDGVRMLDTGGETRDLAREGLRGEFITGRFSPDGEYLALLTAQEALTVTLDEDSGLAEYGTDPGQPFQVVWSSDSRFFLYPGRGGVVVGDTRDFGVDVVLTDQTFTGVGVIPGSEG